MSKKGKVYVGTSGWHYKHWIGEFYPEDIRSKEFIDYYLKFFRTVELNNSFYKLPSVETYRDWKNSVPPDFIFSVKGSRYITHTKKMKPPIKEGIDNFMERAESLKSKLGPVLFQLPPGWKVNAERLENFLENLPKQHRYTFEFRNHTWYADDVLELLKKYNAAFCIYELEHHLSPEEITADFVYIRLHGPDGKYAGSYDDKTLDNWAKKIRNWSDDNKDIYCYFDNDQKGYAAFNAIRLKEMLK